VAAVQKACFQVNPKKRFNLLDPKQNPNQSLDLSDDQAYYRELKAKQRGRNADLRLPRFM
jgi:hypothetical protein